MVKHKCNPSMWEVRQENFKFKISLCYIVSGERKERKENERISNTIHHIVVIIIQPCLNELKEFFRKFIMMAAL